MFIDDAEIYRSKEEFSSEKKAKKDLKLFKKSIKTAIPLTKELCKGRLGVARALQGVI